MIKLPASDSDLPPLVSIFRTRLVKLRNYRSVSCRLRYDAWRLGKVYLSQMSDVSSVSVTWKRTDHKNNQDSSKQHIPSILPSPKSVFSESVWRKW
ncbi:hypothetical protein BaRGS_00020065 [Batillaria attramentaria]|uniref:Uncharacterized protein n=1 Tax=Batillaria attramentaria TaxID=370345 RepID=A0ABD0KN50_9CAEN